MNIKAGDLLVEDIVRSVMTPRVVTVDSQEPVRRALQLMDENDIGAIVVTVAENPEGVVTEKDVVRRIARETLELDRPVGEIMTRPLISINSEAPVTQALYIMVERKVRRLPVLKDGRLVGIIVERDIMRWLIDRPDVILDLFSLTAPNVAKEAVAAILRELQLREKI